MILGITGTIGAGKGAVVDFLVKEKGFAHYSMRNFLVEEIRRRGMLETRDSMYIVANEFRAKFGPGYLVEQYLERARKAGGDVVIESIRTLGEVAALKREPGARLIAIDAPQKVRFERIIARQSSTDHITFEKFVADEEKESTSTDPGVNNLLGCRALADVVVENTGTFEELHGKINSFIKQATIDFLNNEMGKPVSGEEFIEYLKKF